MNRQQLTFMTEIVAPRPWVYQNLTNPYLIQQWFCDDAHMNPTSGGHLYLYWRNNNYHAHGVFSNVQPDEEITFSWHGSGDEEPTTVNIKLRQLHEPLPHTRVEVQHDNVRDGNRDNVHKGWQDGLANLKSILETGYDLRQMKRPFLGVLLQGAGDDGILINGTVAGSGADEIGLQDQDVLTSLNGVPLRTFADFQPALAGKVVGETVDVTFRREGQEHTAVLPLKPRPLYPTPETPAAFAQQLRLIQSGLDEELADIFAGVGDEAASQSPAAGEWSARQVLAHLILTERATQTMMTLQLNNPQAFNWPGNEDAPLTAVLMAYPTNASLLEAWQRAEAETAVLVAHLPADFAQHHKIDYAQLGQTLLLGLPAHTRGHFVQIREALTAVQSSPPI